jgi:hypothetical protein
MMGKKRRTSEERQELRRQRAEWEQVSKDFAAMAERLRTRWREEDERRERRRRLLYRFLPFRRPA